MIFNENGSIVMSDYSEKVFNNYYQMIDEDYQWSLNQMEVLSESLDNVKDGVKNFLSAAKKKIIKVIGLIVSGINKAIEFVDSIVRKAQILPFRKQIHNNFDKLYQKCKEKNFIPEKFKQMISSAICLRVFFINDDAAMNNLQTATQKFHSLMISGGTKEEFSNDLGTILIGEKFMNKSGYSFIDIDFGYDPPFGRLKIHNYFWGDEKRDNDIEIKMEDWPKLKIHDIINNLIDYATHIDKISPVLMKQNVGFSKLIRTIDQKYKDTDDNKKDEKNLLNNSLIGAKLLQIYANELFPLRDARI